MSACAIGSWRLVERPFRSKRISIERVRLIAAIGAATLAAAGGGVLFAKGLPGRLSVEAAAINQAVDTNYRCAISDYLAFGRSRACVMNLPSRNPADADVVLLGNSHAQMYAPVWTSIIAGRGRTGLLVPVNGCLPTVRANISRQCMEMARDNLAEISKLPRVRTVVIGLSWEHKQDELIDSSGRPVDDIDNRALISALDDLIDQLERMGMQVVLIGPIAEPGWNLASILSRQLAFGHVPDRPVFLPAADFERRLGSAIQHFESRRDIGFARPDKVQCPDERCYFVLDGRSLFSDSNHLASAELPRFRAMFEAVLPAKPLR
jgi:hypothetical protein